MARQKVHLGRGGVPLRIEMEECQSMADSEWELSLQFVGALRERRHPPVGGGKIEERKKLKQTYTSTNYYRG